MKNCLNCNSQLHGPYCSQCGQNNDYNDLTFKNLIKRGFYNVFSLESKFSQTFNGMFTNPGKLSHQYISGKRKKYVNPVNYFLLSSSLLVFITIYLLDVDLVALSKETTEKIALIDPNTVESEKAVKMQQFLVPWIKENFRIFNFGLYFFYPFFLKLLFWKKFKQVEFVVFSLYMVSQINFLTILDQLLFNYFDHTGFIFFGLIIKVGYIIYSTLSLMIKNKVKTFIKSFFALLLTITSFFIVMLIAFFIFHGDKIMAVSKSTSN